MRRIVAFVFLFCLTLAPVQESLATTKKQGSSPPNPKYASIVIDAETGAVVSERYPDKLLHPASLTKMMTLLLLFEALENGNIRLNDKIMISQNAANEQPSKIGLVAGASIRVEDAILAVVTKSANDISTAIGEHLAGSESRFALRMTRRAHDIGMRNTTFKNAHGLHHPQQITTARDMATLGRYILFRYPNYYRYFGTKQFTYRGKTYTNHNRLMQSYPGMDGFKTGFINASGFNLVASAKHGDKRLIGVVFGGRSWKTRNDHMAEILNQGFVKLPAVQFAAKSKGIAVAAIARAPTAPAPRPAKKPAQEMRQGTGTLQLPPQSQQPYASLSALTPSPHTVAIPHSQSAPDITAQAAADARAAVNRGDFSELTGEGDYDAGTARRVETGLLAAAVYKGEHKRAQQFADARAAALAPPAIADAPSATQAAIPQQQKFWAVQIGAYTSRIATDEALRGAHKHLPTSLSHASPLVVPLQTANGMLFRARLGGLTRAQASEACRYFRDCLPMEQQ